MKRNYIVAAAAALVIVFGFFIFRGSKASDSSEIIASVKKGEFRVEVETTGELEAKNSVKIIGPTGIIQFLHLPKKTMPSEATWKLYAPTGLLILISEGFTLFDFATGTLLYTPDK
ncbi:MAG: hypothetical protein LW721_03480 [Flammeovirgaceae bacterium]|jgi:hypothetical protein|nr:hypothetical protein [Flammeovirgaceae bacterium]